MKERVKNGLYPVGFAAAFVVLWELAVRWFDVPVYLLPAPTAIIGTFDATLGSHMLVTLAEALVGFLIANVLGLRPFAADRERGVPARDRAEDDAARRAGAAARRLDGHRIFLESRRVDADLLFPDSRQQREGA